METVLTKPSVRNAGLDILRVLACYMVVQIHTGEFFYISPEGGVLNGPGAFWVAIFNSLFRCAVLLFVMISGYFLFPVKDEIQTFFRKKFTRVLFPFLIWCVIYAIYQFLRGNADLSATLINILHIPVNYGTQVGHLWYVYMLLGIYLFAPVISPWLQTAPKQQIRFYLILWAVTMTIPYIHLVFPEIWGECFWNKTPMLYYFSGFLGFAVLGFYIKRFHAQKSKGDYLLGFILILIGYMVTAYLFATRLNTAKSIPELELSWGYDTINVAMLALGFFMLIKNLTFRKPNSWFAKLIEDISLKSYGIYLLHIIILNTAYSLMISWITGQEYLFPLIGLVTFVSSYLVIKLISYLPGSKYITG